MDNIRNESERERMVFVGDSITVGGDWQSWFPEAEVHVEAANGETTDSLPQRLERIVELQPEVIVVLIGTNDFGAGRSVEHVVRSIEYFLAMVRNEVLGARTLVQSIMPRAREFETAIQDTNRHLRQFVPSLRAQFLDLWPALADESGELDPSLSDDRLHLNAEGYAAWLAELRPALERLEEAPPMTRPLSIIP